MLTLCAPKPPLRSQKSLYGAPGGGTGTGKNDRILGLAGSATSIKEAWLGPSAQPPSEFVSTIFRFGNGSTVWTAKSRWYGGSKDSSLTSLGLRTSVMSRITILLSKPR